MSRDLLGIYAGYEMYGFAPNPWSWYDPFGLIIVYRNIRAEEDPASGLDARRPDRRMSPAGHIMNGSRENFQGSQFISTTTDLDVAQDWRQPGQRTVAIDTDMLEPSSIGEQRVLDVSGPERARGAGLRGRAYSNAVTSREVLLEGRVPPWAMQVVESGCG